MLTKSQVSEAKCKTLQLLSKIGVVLTEMEEESIEIADFGFDELETSGLQLITYINTERYCAKDLVLFPRQTCPEHKHPPIGDQSGKMETFRCRWGSVDLYVEGEVNVKFPISLPTGSEDYYTVFHQIKLTPGQQYTIPPNTLHWFQAGEEGAIISEFSSQSQDECDSFTDPRVKRLPVIEH